MTHSGQHLRQILNKVHNLQNQGQQSLVVFDLDSTLFDVSPRLEKILIDFANLEQNKVLFPSETQRLLQIKTLRSDWGIQGALVRAGLDGHNPLFQEAVREFWHTHFFSSYYLQYDLPYEGAIEYVQAVFKAGAHVAYLTGRDAFRMGTGTVEVLRQWDLPLLKDQAELILKPHKSMDDAEFKTDWFREQLSKNYQYLCFFENEPVNIHHMQKNLQSKILDIVFMKSTHAGKAPAPQDIPHIMHFLLDPHE